MVLKRRPQPHPSTWRETVEMRLRRYGQTRHTLLRNLVVAPVTEVGCLCLLVCLIICLVCLLVCPVPAVRYLDGA